MANTTLQEYLTFVNALTDQAGKVNLTKLNFT